MTEIDFDSVRRVFDAHESTARIMTVKLQPAGVEQLMVHEADLPVFNNILVDEASKLVKIANPTKMSIQNANVENATFWWKQLKPTFTGDLKYISFTMLSIGGSEMPDLVAITPIVRSVVQRMIATKPVAVFINILDTPLSEKTFTFTVSQYIKGAGHLASFSIAFLGSETMRSLYGPLLFEVLKHYLPKLKKLYIVFNFPCENCIRRIFKSMDWEFPESQLDPKKYWNTSKSFNLSIDTMCYARKMTKYNKFSKRGGHLEVHYFYGEEMSAEWAAQNHKSATWNL